MPYWLRLALPSAVDLVFIILLLSLSIGVLAPRLLGDAGTGWHIRNGELILRSHAVTRTDPFSATMGGQTWYAWEWLYDAAIAAIYRHLGLNGVVFVTAALIALTFAIALRLALAFGASLPVAAIFVVLSAGASTIHFFARPHVLSWLLTLVWFWILDSAETNPVRGRRLYWLPLLMLLWVNLHGGFVVGFILLVFYTMGSIFNRSSRRKILVTVGALCLAASFINPYGYQLHLHVYRYLTDRFLMDHIDEFLSPNFHGIAQQCFAVVLLLGVVAVAVRPKSLRPSQLLVLLFAAYSGLFASRNLPVSSILITLIATPLLSRAMAEAKYSSAASAWLRRWARFCARMTTMELRSRGNLWAVAASVGLLGACWQGRAMHADFDAKRFPVQAVDYLSQHPIADPIFCPDAWGGYLIFRLYPQNKVVVDDRHDLYGDEFLKKYLNAIRVEPGWNTLLDEQHVRWALLPAGSPLANMVQVTGQWTIRSQDDVAVLYERAQLPRR